MPGITDFDPGRMGDRQNVPGGSSMVSPQLHVHQSVTLVQTEAISSHGVSAGCRGYSSYSLETSVELCPKGERLSHHLNERRREIMSHKKHTLIVRVILGQFRKSGKYSKTQRKI